VAGGVALVAALFALDVLTEATVPVSLIAVGPLVAAVGGRERATAWVAALATAAATVADALRFGPLDGMDVIRLVTVAVIGGLAVVLAMLRQRLENRGTEAGEANRRAQETLALLDVIFAGTPAGLAFQDLDGRFVRVNDRLAEINGVPPEAHIGRTVDEVLPAFPEVGEEVRRVAATGTPETEIELRGETPAQPGVQREWVASYWPVRAAGGELLGVGTVVFEITERRAAERALRTQTDRYETLLTALSEVGEGMVVLEEDRCVYANAAFEQLSGYTFPELAALDSLYELTVPEQREDAARRARLRTEEGLVDRRYTLAMSWSCATSPRAGARRRNASGCWRARRCWPRRARCSTSRSTRSARSTASRGCACATSPTRAWSCWAHGRARRGGRPPSPAIRSARSIPSSRSTAAAPARSRRCCGAGARRSPVTTIRCA
jgi:PAS domain S-box-containing protein